MTEIRLRHACFRVDPVKNIVGQGDKLAYYIVVTRGETAGITGAVSVAADTFSTNDPRFEATARFDYRRGFSRLGRLFAAWRS